MDDHLSRLYKHLKRDVNMKQLIVISLAVLMVGQAFAQKKNARLDSLMSSIYPNDKPGAAIAIVENGKVIVEKGYGIANLEPKTLITPSTNFNIGSMTKQFTAYCVLKLISKKRLSLNDKLIKFFPDFNPEVGNAVTVRDLLTHSSGIIDYYDYVNTKKYKEFTDKDILPVLEPIDSVYFRPGSRFRYSNTGYCLLSLIVAKVSGKPYPEFVRDNIFDPLRMEKSDVIHPGFKVVNRAFGYEFENDSFRISDAKQSLFFSTEGDGGIYTSIDDYVKWIMAIQSGKGLNPRLIKEAQSPRFLIDSSRNVSYGFGWFIAGSGNDRLIYHPGSNGGFRTIVLMKPSEKYTVVIFSNRSGIDLEDLVHQVNKIYEIKDKAYVSPDSLTS